MSQLDNLSLDRFIYRQNSNYESLSTSPFSGLQAGITSNNAYNTSNDPGSVDSPASSIATGTPIVSSPVSTSNGGNQHVVAGLQIPGGKVSLTQGFTDSAGQQFQLDNLTAFDGSGIATVVLSYFGIFLTPGASGIPPGIIYTYNGDLVSQPIVIGSGRVLANGNATSNFPSDWLVNRIGTGKYTLNPLFGFSDAEYSVLLTPHGPSPCAMTVQATSTSQIDIWAYDLSGALVDSEFSFEVFTNTQ